jgi:hypothetical protein
MLAWFAGGLLKRLDQMIGYTQIDLIFKLVTAQGFQIASLGIIALNTTAADWLSCHLVGFLFEKTEALWK